MNLDEVVKTLDRIKCVVSFIFPLFLGQAQLCSGAILGKELGGHTLLCSGDQAVPDQTRASNMQSMCFSPWSHLSGP